MGSIGYCANFAEELPVSDENTQRLRLLNQVWLHLNLRHWEKFVKAIGVTTLDGAQVKRIQNNKGNVPAELYERLLAYCREKNLTVADTAKEKQPATLTDDESALGWAGFLGALALTDEEGSETAERFEGRYFYGLLDEDNTVAILNCHLSDKLSNDFKAPKFFAWRRRSNGELRRISGNYFFNDHFLFLVGSRVGFGDVRVSTLKVEDSQDDKFKGIASGVSYANSMYSGRCVLWRDEKRQLAGRHAKRDAMRLLPPDIYGYLFDEEVPGMYMKVEPE
jgi:hypothetical protein